MTRYTLDKRHKLCSRIAVDRLFEKDGSQSAIAYPLRAVWRDNDRRTTGNDVQFLIIVPKKRLRHAVDRVKMRRRIRESYRLSRPEMIPESLPVPVDIAFIYVASSLIPYAAVESSMKRLLGRIFPAQTGDQSSCDAL